MDIYKELDNSKQFVNVATQHFMVALRAACRDPTPKCKHVMFIITCIGDYFPLGVALNEKKDHESDNFEIDLIDKY